MVEALRSSAVFGSLRTEIIAEMADAVELRQVESGEAVFSEGDRADSTVFVISGGLRVSRRGRDGKLLVYNQIHPGQSIGEMAMILQQPRSQDVTAVRDSTLALLSREAFEALLLQHPIELNRTFLKAVHDQFRVGSEVQEKWLAQTIALVPLDRQAGADILAPALVQALQGLIGRSGKQVGHLRSDSALAQRLMRGDTTDEDADRAQLEDQYAVMVFEAGAADDAWARFAIRQADQVVFVTSATRDPELTDLERQLQAVPGYALKRKHLVLMHEADRSWPVSPLPWVVGRDLERIYPLRSGWRADAEHLARFLTGNAVGVVLGGGGARGFAHLGVLRALNESKVPVDLIGGNSMGALIGAQLACGHSLEQILKQTQHFAKGGERLTVPVVSIVAGRRVERDLRRMFGELMIEQLWRPYFAAACNLTRGNTTVQSTGPLWRAVLASNSPAGLFPPVVIDGDLMVDGAILENVPVQPMRLRLGTPLERRRGNGTVIAVDVDVPESLRADPSLTRVTPLSTLKRKFMSRAPDSPSIARILYSAGHVGSLNQRPRTIAQADHYLEPPVGNFPLMAYQSGAEIAEVGYRYAMEKIASWDQQLMMTPAS
ncbi:cyclic nucleotide-binding and patatin-like phospholipase domain-containing protein [Pelomonas sp. KK5]|uniref:cyclic nucleotide-binding and patatin-like phospholipase domain-containing protein n=1 Tax=Pelomonas sp. KK5 TaxID=1855730 RepID=UPI00097C2408|nr:cyclic nucleotide-binding and patatin-like phospholipase domain-containing protein [Pelomonas sp. KK5]